MNKFKAFIVGVGKEFKRIKWPSKKEMVKYTGATLSIILLFAAMFSLMDIIFYFIGII